MLQNPVFGPSKSYISAAPGSEVFCHTAYLMAFLTIKKSLMSTVSSNTGVLLYILLHAFVNQPLNVQLPISKSAKRAQSVLVVLTVY